MATSTQQATIATNNPYMIGLLADDGTSPGAGPEVVTRWDRTSPVTWYLAPGDFNGNGINDWSEHGAGAAMQDAVNAWQAVCGLTFQQVGSAAQANLIERINDANGALGTHQYPFEGSDQAGGNFNQGTAWTSPNNNSIGGYSYITILHELGHGLGLEHPHADGGDDAFPGLDNGSNVFTDAGDNGLNQGIWTVMSYIDGWDEGGGGGPSTRPYGWQGTPMAFDIAAIQLLYGPNTTTAAGNDTYALPTVNAVGTFWSCIWDTGGTDTIVAGNTATSATIDLNDATLLNAAGGGGFVSRHAGIFGGFTIANSVLIENATGGNGNDTLTGNEYANTLSGGNGNDKLSGSLGADTLDGGAGNDIYDVASEATLDTIIDASGSDGIYTTIGRSLVSLPSVDNIYLQGTGHIQAIGNAGNNLMAGNAANNILYGQAGRDTLQGFAGNDRLYGQGGQDTLSSGTGNDRFVYQSVAEIVPGSGDIILDLDDSGDDIIDLTAIPGVANFIGTGPFTAPGQVRIVQAFAHVQIEINATGNGGAEGIIHLYNTTIGTGVGQVNGSDLLL